MSEYTIDRWIHALEFENYRLQFKPNNIHVKILQSEIQVMESMPAAAAIGDGNLDQTLQNLESLKQDLASGEHIIGLAIQLRNFKDQMREKGVLQFNLDAADEILEGIQASFDKRKIEQRQRQWRNLASLRKFWPEADGPRRRRIVELLRTYTRRRFMWGLLNLQMGTPVRLSRWASRMYKR